MEATCRPWTVRPDRAALLIIDMQNAFVEKGGSLEIPMARQCVPRIKKLLNACRSLAVPVIYTVSAHYIGDVMVSPLELAYQPQLRDKFIVPGSHVDQVFAELAPQPGDHIVRKYRFDAFYNTNLETLLHTLKYPDCIDTLIITGTVTNICCESTARSAYMRDYKVAFTSDATGGLDRESHEATLRIMGRCFARVMQVDEIIAEMQSSREQSF